MKKISSPLKHFSPSQSERGILVVVILALIAAGFLLERYDIGVFANTQNVRDWVGSFGIWAPVAYIALMTIAIVIVPVPDFVIGLAASILFPWYLASLYTLVADFIGSTLTFTLARNFGRPMVERFVKKEQLVQMDTLAKELGPKTIFIFRLIPGFNFDLVGYISGLTPLSYRAYIIATMVGILPRRIGTYFLIDKGLRIDPFIVLIGVLLSMLIVPVVAYWIWLKKRKLS